MKAVIKQINIDIETIKNEIYILESKLESDTNFTDKLEISNRIQYCRGQIRAYYDALYLVSENLQQLKSLLDDTI